MLTSPSCKWWISRAIYMSNGLDIPIIETLHNRTALKNGFFWTLLSSYIGWPPCMKWTKWGLWYADISLLQAIDNPCGLWVQRFGHGYHRNLTWLNRFEKWNFLDNIVILTADVRSCSEPNEVCVMLTSPWCKLWISPAVYRSNGLGMPIIETLHVRTALKNGSFWTLFSSYCPLLVNKVIQMRSEISWHLVAANDV